MLATAVLQLTIQDLEVVATTDHLLLNMVDFQGVIKTLEDVHLIQECNKVSLTQGAHHLYKHKDCRALPKEDSQCVPLSPHHILQNSMLLRCQTPW